jgi:hypothetical protein
VRRFSVGTSALSYARRKLAWSARARRLMPRTGFAALLLSLCAAATAGAEELALLAGATDTDDHTSGSYAWAMEYRQHLLSHLEASFRCLNEGHLPGHYRDGGALQLWVGTPWRERFALSFGAGPYVYFDTQGHGNFQGCLNDHGAAALLSARASYDLKDHWSRLALQSPPTLRPDHSRRGRQLARRVEKPTANPLQLLAVATTDLNPGRPAWQYESHAGRRWLR